MEIYQSLLQTTENTRDLGGLVGADHTVTRYWSVLRSDVPLDPSASDVDLLRSHHITTIIDMRDEPAIRQKPNGFVGREGFRVVSCPIVEGSEIPDSVAEVPHGYLRIAGSNGMGQALQVIADLPEDEGVLFHCTAGKDRSGVLSVILLLLAGVSVRDVVT
ncbi:MAG: tyrosine-protein phosphatase, partial [Butyrivibrio sp.]|nr:tyrosine-protein phosphatase [Butyrivibrio sp.]